MGWWWKSSKLEKEKRLEAEYALEKARLEGLLRELKFDVNRYGAAEKLHEALSATSCYTLGARDSLGLDAIHDLLVRQEKRLQDIEGLLRASLRSPQRLKPTSQ